MRRMHNKQEIYTLKGTRVPNMYEKWRKICENFRREPKKRNRMKMNSSIIHFAFALFLILTEYELPFSLFFLTMNYSQKLMQTSFSSGDRRKLCLLSFFSLIHFLRSISLTLMLRVISREFYFCWQVVGMIKRHRMTYVRLYYLHLI